MSAYEEMEEFIPNPAILAHEMKSENSFRSYSSKISWRVFILICLFTLGSWIDISGMWCELPFMIDELPERWRLPSILSAISQTAQIGPFLFMFFKLAFKKKFDNVKVIYVIFSIGALSCFLLAFLWNKSIVYHNEQRSIYLYILNFFLSLLDGMSTLTFLPYIGEHYSKEYVIPNYVGESLSSLLPGILAMIQGYKEEVCLNQTIFSNQTKIFQNYKPRYSVFLYFIFMFLLLLISILSFTILNYSKFAREARKNRLVWINLDMSSQEDLDEPESFSHGFIKYHLKNKLAKSEIKSLFMLIFIVTFIYYGFLPGLLSYSTIPYSNKFFHLSINLSNIFLPFSIFISIWSYEVSIKRIILESIVPLFLSFYIFLISAMSPCPIFLNDFGGYLIVFCWVTSSCMFMRLRCLIASKLEKYGKNVLFTMGCYSVLGQVFGGLIIYLMVEHLRLFKDKPNCVELTC